MKNYKKPDPIAPPATWAVLLQEAVTKPGIIGSAYSAFHNYSMGNQMLAYYQCSVRGITPGPIGTFKNWLEKKRPVKKGEKAIVLCQPRPWSKEVEKEDGDKERVGGVFFTYRAGWFVLSQTEGEDVDIPSLPEWDLELALEELNIQRIPFDLLDGNTQGFARGRGVAINPVATHPRKTMMHELAHILLGHTNREDLLEVQDMTRGLREVEAESVALIVCDSLGIPGAELSRGYIQNWYKSSQEIPDKNAQRIFTAADKILKAGRPKKENGNVDSSAQDE